MVQVSPRCACHRGRVKIVVPFVPDSPVATTAWCRCFPDRSRRGMVPPQLNVPSEEAVALHRTVLARVGTRSPLREVTTTASPGTTSAPGATTGVRVRPDPGVKVRTDETGGAPGSRRAWPLRSSRLPAIPPRSTPRPDTEALRPQLFPNFSNPRAPLHRRDAKGASRQVEQVSVSMGQRGADSGESPRPTR
jgi:hypothetical protein